MRSRFKTVGEFAEKVTDFLKEEDGPTTVEYAIMLTMIVLVCISTIGSIGHEANETFDDVARSLKKGSHGN